MTKTPRLEVYRNLTESGLLPLFYHRIRKRRFTEESNLRAWFEAGVACVGMCSKLIGPAGTGARPLYQVGGTCVDGIGKDWGGAGGGESRRQH